MRIIIATGIFPPRIGGPALYAQNLALEFEKAGHTVKVLTYGIEHRMPTGIRHAFFFVRMLFALPRSDMTIALDTFSVGFPTVLACRILGKKNIIRTGGDFLWEGYVERTKEKVLLKDFYTSTRGRWNAKEKIIFRLTRWTLCHVSALVFSTSWQRDIFTSAYGLMSSRNFIIENFYGSKIPSTSSPDHTFVGSVRPLVWKNTDLLQDVFKKLPPDTKLDIAPAPYEAFMQKIAKSYAVILISLGDISPNMILDAIRFNKPFILTHENGIYERIKEIGLFVDPLNPTDITQKILWLLRPENYAMQKKKIENFNFTHTWQEISAEFLNIYKQL